MDASIALTLALAVVCDLLRQWDQLGPGLPILLGWLLEGDDLEGLVQSPHQVTQLLGELGQTECPSPRGGALRARGVSR